MRVAWAALATVWILAGGCGGTDSESGARDVAPTADGAAVDGDAAGADAGADSVAPVDAAVDSTLDAAADVLAPDAGCPDGVPCEDGNPCTADGRCQSGLCVGALVSCDDENPCTVDSCDLAAGCVNEPCALHLAPCDDGVACTTGDTCRSGQCLGSADCDDGDPCTADACDLATAACAHESTGGIPCDDGDACTTGDVCTAGGCAGAPDDTTPSCIPGPACLAATTITALPFTVDGDTTAETDDLDAEGCSGLYEEPYTGAGSPDALYRLTAPHAGIYRFSLETFEGALDGILSVHTGCPGTSGAGCLGADDVIGAGGEQLELSLADAQTVYVLVDGYGQEQGGPYRLSVNAPETDCGNGLDDDGNGQTDCADVLCLTTDVVCGGAVEACASAPAIVALLPSVHHTVSFDGNAPVFVPDPCSPEPFAYDAYDRILRVDVVETGRYQLTVAKESGKVASFRLADSCPPAPSCSGSDELGVPASIIRDWQAGESLYLLMDGISKTSVAIDIRAMETACANGVDDEGDGLSDCADPDCLSEPTCAPKGVRCADPFVLTAPSVTESAAGAVDVYSPGSCEAPGGGAPELVFSFTATVTAVHHFQVSGEGASATLSVFTACVEPEALCTTPQLDPAAALLHAGETVWLYADGIACDGSAPACDVTIEVIAGPPVETSCSDGADEDGDGQTDCVDPDCERDPHCAADGDWCSRPIALDGEALLAPAARIEVGATTGGPGVYADLLPGMCGEGFPAAAGPDLVYSLTAPAGGRYRFTLSPATPGDGWSLTLATTCPPAVGSCLAQDPAAVEAELRAGETVYAVVGHGPPSGVLDGAFSLAVTVDQTCDP